MEEGKKRDIVTIVGASTGALYLSIERLFPCIESNVFRYTLLSLLLIPIIQLSRYIKQENETFLMCVVFLSVTVNRGMDVSLIKFAFHHIVDTSIGIAIAIVMNHIKFDKLNQSR